MIYTRNEIKAKYENNYRIDVALKNREIFKVAKGLYSDTELPNPFEIITKKYSNAIFTLDSAFFIHDLTDVIPQKEHLATKRNALRIKDNNISQVFITENIFELGKEAMEYQGAKINIYNKERMLIELIRNKKSFGYDYYKEIINNYRENSANLDTRKIQEYISFFPTEEHLFDVIRSEVF